MCYCTEKCSPVCSAVTLLKKLLLEDLTVYMKLIKTYLENTHQFNYGLIGGSAVILDLGIFSFLYNVFGIVPIYATIFSVSMGMIYACLLNGIFNFKTTDFLKSRFVSYATICFFSLIISTLIIKLLLLIEISPNTAKLISLLAIIFIQYLFYKKFILDTHSFYFSNKHHELKVLKTK